MAQIAVQFLVIGKVLVVQVAPLSVEVIAMLVPEPNAQNAVPSQPMADQAEFEGRVRKVHVIPSVEVAASAVVFETVQKTVPFQATLDQPATFGSDRSVHVIPSGEVAAVVEPLATAQ